MAVVAISDSILTDIADAIRSKNGQETLYKPSDMPDAIESLSGDGAVVIFEEGENYQFSDSNSDGNINIEDLVISGTIQITENGTYNVTQYASAEVNIPSGTGYTPEDVAIRNYTGDIVLPTAVRIAPYAFNGSGITTLYAPYVIRTSDRETSGGAGSYVFANCASLTSVNMPEYASVGSGGYQFYKCTALVSANMHKSEIGQHMFDGCTALRTFATSNTSNMNGSSFNGCTSLESLDLSTKRVHTSEFNGCTKLATLVLRSTTVSTLSNINAFTNTPFASGKAGGTLYVPNNLIASYQSASNWSTILGYSTNQIKSIESTHTDQTAPIDLTLYYIDGTLLPTT